LFLTSAPFDGLEARSLGLVHFTCTSDDLDSAVNQQVDLVLHGGPNALRAAKQLIRDVSAPQDRDRLGEHTARLLASLRISPEGQEGLSAFLERRKATWICE
jgi:methylglutaconyl-CoA hydratase